MKDNILQGVIETRQAQLQQQAIQAKLTVGEPRDKYEQEAEAMDSKVMSRPDTAVQRESTQKAPTKPLVQMSYLLPRDRRSHNTHHRRSLSLS